MENIDPATISPMKCVAKCKMRNPSHDRVVFVTGCYVEFCTQHEKQGSLLSTTSITVLILSNAVKFSRSDRINNFD